MEEIGWRMTCIRTFDQRPLYVPNAIFSQISIQNPSRMRNRRIYETIVDDLHAASRVLVTSKFRPLQYSYLVLVVGMCATLVIAIVD